MNILILNWKDIKNSEAGGAEIIAFEFARKLVKDGHDVVFFSRSFKGCRPEETVDGVNIIRRGNKLTVYIHAFLYYKSLKKKPDKVVDMINTLCWQTPLYVPQRNRVAYVNQLAKEVLFFEFPFPLSFISYFLERFEYIPYRNTKCLCYSKSTKNDLISFGIKKEKIRIFPMGLDHDRYKKRGIKDKDPLFIFVARLVKMKRADLCIKAMRKVVLKYPSSKLAIIGNGPDEKRLQFLINKFNLVKNVILVDKDNFFIDKNIKDVKVKLMQKAWAILLPSVKEGWGMVITEAAACGVPAIVTDVTGLRDSVLNNKTGIVLSKNPKEEELAHAMMELIRNNNKRESFSREAIKWSKNFTWKKSFKEFYFHLNN